MPFPTRLKPETVERIKREREARQIAGVLDQFARMLRAAHKDASRGRPIDIACAADWLYSAHRLRMKYPDLSIAMIEYAHARGPLP